MGKIIGIDLGTTNSVVAVVESGRSVVIANREGHSMTPSVVGRTHNGEILVGHAAKRRSIIDPEHTIFSVKRFMGRSFHDLKGVAPDLPFPVQSGEAGETRIGLGDTTMSPPEIAALILRNLRLAAQDYLGEADEVVITVPAYFNDAQRQATREAAELAGFRVRRILNEPTAAALAYALDKLSGETIAVFDMGGGTFDISILKLADDVVEVKATAGDTLLGGDDIDARLMLFLLNRFQQEHGIDLSDDKPALQRLREVAESAKIELSNVHETVIHLPFLGHDAAGPKHLSVTLSRAEFEGMMEDLFQRTVEPCRQALRDAGLRAGEINHVILVGGSTRIPRLQQIVQELFGKAPNRSVNPDQAVALGAAIHGAVLSGEIKELSLLDVTPMSLGIETAGGVFATVVERNTTIPSRCSRAVSTVTDNQSAVEIKVFEGEHAWTKLNNLLGVFELSGIQAAPRGAPQIEIIFDVDANGILKVTARDKVTQSEEQATIVRKGSGAKEPVRQAASIRPPVNVDPQPLWTPPMEEPRLPNYIRRAVRADAVTARKGRVMEPAAGISNFAPCAVAS
ncbi:MAG: molecular chaperone DnaK [Bryobacteraceae bacterium]